MAITSSGIGSNLDVNGIIKQLMVLEQKPLTALETKEADYLAKISAVGSLKGVISSLQGAAGNLVPPSGTTPFDQFNRYQASVADSNIASVKTDSKAVAGSYRLEVTQLAQEHRIATRTGAESPFDADGKLKGGGGTLSIGLGTAGSATPNKSTPISIEAGATAEQIRDAINAVRAGVSATVINGVNGKQLALVGDAVGSDQSISLSGIEELAFGGSGEAPAGFAESQAAQGSLFKLNGIEVGGTTNTVSTAIDGITLTLLKKSEAGVSTMVNVNSDTSALNDAIEGFVKSYNDFNTLAAGLGSYNPTTKVAGILNGDSTLRMAQSVLRGALGNVPGELSTARLQRLSEIGVELQKDGSLKLDKGKLSKAVKNDVEGVANLAAAYGKSFKTVTEGLVGGSGALAARTEGYNTSIEMLKKQRAAINTRLVGIEARYRKQFTALDTMMSQMNQTSNYLTTQLASLAKIGNSSK